MTPKGMLSPRELGARTCQHDWGSLPAGKFSYEIENSARFMCLKCRTIMGVGWKPGIIEPPRLFESTNDFLSRFNT